MSSSPSFIKDPTIKQHNVGSMTVFVLEKNDIVKAKDVWVYLEEKIGDIGLTCRWDWVETWLEHYGEVVEYWFLIGVEDGNLCGITLLTRETHRSLPLPVQAYHIGTNGEPYAQATQVINNSVLVREKVQESFYEALIQTIQTLFPWEEIIFDEFDQKDAEIILDTLKEDSGRIVTNTQLCRVFDFAIMKNADSNILSHLSSETRYTIKRSMKVFNNDLTLEWAENAEQALAILDELIVLYQKTWKKRGRAGMFDSARFSGFQRALIQKFFKHGSIIMCKIKSKEYGTLGCVYMLVSKGIAYGYQLGLKDFSDIQLQTINKKRLRVGFIVHTLCMQECFNHGLKAYNFSTGEYRYKKELTNTSTKVVTISLMRNFKPVLRHKLVKLYSESKLAQKFFSLLK